MITPNTLYASLPNTIFDVMSGLARQHNAANLGQGFPDDAGSEVVRRVAAEHLITGYNQYPPMMGTPELRRAMAAHEQRFYGLEVDAMTQTLVTSGATEALAACIFALVNEGDEVVIIEPAYDAYLPLVQRAGGVAKFITLKAPDYTLNAHDVAAAFTSKTKAVIVNNPLNPLGRVFSAAELELLRAAAEAHNAVVIADEVYEHLVFDGVPHTTFLSLKGMASRCLKIGSAGKTFSLTGLKVGYITGAPELIHVVNKAHQFLTFTTPPNLQAGVAAGLNQDDAYFMQFTADMQAKRDVFAAHLQDLGLKLLPSAGTYFQCVDITGTKYEGRDAALSQALVTHWGLATIPISAFYRTTAQGGTPQTNLLRFCYCKSPTTMARGVNALKAFVGSGGLG